MIVRAIAHKGGALAAAFANVIVAAKVLPADSALLFLSQLSLIQLFVVLGGFGVTQKLVKTHNQVSHPADAVPMVSLTLVLGACLIAVQGYLSGAPSTFEIIALNIATLLLLNGAEIVRCASGIQSGYVSSIISTMVIAILMLVLGKIAWWFAIVPIAAGMHLFPHLLPDQRPIQIMVPKLGDIVRAARILFANQAYNLLVVIIGYLMSSTEAALALVLVYRFNIFFNWQSFYWMRFGHKETDGTIPSEHRKRSLRFSWLNVLALSGLLMMIVLVFAFDLDTRLNEQRFDRNFMVLLAFYASIRVPLNFIFPYEIYLVYLGTLKDDVHFLFVAIGSLAILALAIYYVPNPFVIIGLMEAFWAMWRLNAWYRLRRKQGNVDGV